MSKNQNLLKNVNDFFVSNHIDPIDPENDELKNLFEVSLKNIWQNVLNHKKRAKLAAELNLFFLPFFGTDNIKQFTRQFCDRLDIDFPGENDYLEIYQWCLNEFALFEKQFLENQTIDPDVFKTIVKKLLLVIRENKNNLISRIGIRKNDYSFHTYHAINSTILSLIGGIELNYQEPQLEELGLATLMHDLGMLKIPEHILNKEGALTNEEFNTIKSHVGLAYKLLNTKKDFNQNILDAIAQHHEYDNGSGYPRKMKGDQIHQYAKIIAIADAFEAQISFRVYRKSKSGYLAMKEVIANANNRFDTNVLGAFLKSISIYPPGTLVQLNDHSIGIVANINPGAPLRPLLKLIINSQGLRLNGQTLLNLKENNSLFIVSVLNKDDYRKKNKNE